MLTTEVGSVRPHSRILSAPAGACPCILGPYSCHRLRLVKQSCLATFFPCRSMSADCCCCISTKWPRAALLDLLLDAQLVCVAALLFPAVDCSGVQASIAPAQHDQFPVSAESLICTAARHRGTSVYRSSAIGSAMQTQPDGRRACRAADALPADHLVLIVLPR